MKTLTKAMICTVAMAGFASASAHAATLEQIKKSGTIRIAVANEIPYGYMTPAGKAKGAGPDVAKAIMKELGIKNIKWVTTNFSSLIPGLQADRFDMVAAEMAIRPDRCKQVLFSEPNSSYGEGLLVAKGNPKGIHAFSDFAKKPDLKVAIMAGADQLEMMQKLGVKDGNMVTIASNADAISTVATGRADAYAATSLTVGGLAKKGKKVETASDFKDPMIDGKAVRSWGGFTFASGNESLQKAVNTALAKYKKTPEWTKSLTGYGFTEADLKGSMERTTAQLCKSE
ncbi:ectoine/hydroxyectoine ABC transporter substrate-binding protein EhuB [Rhizobium oryziradicis]|uniref:Ectoine/hydroxyectoine ABC transporter substrate-binding protein EhuB n=1 Tax=Rhizobium oryziradicis TaxID=1867956 RepID=A0A1Q8ZV82_9HYPH|nr:ectoine/hydroxyectoine ABC transporter substrate-binding protein EhuB [Rhizobium oryziradicis]OLP45962.1 ectoine/hydroxyectoine ABC transporter substrate-binding protein EhuB [Rhizobium oryziradicis]